jgi:hypothetical protein
MAASRPLGAGFIALNRPSRSIRWLRVRPTAKEDPMSRLRTLAQGPFGAPASTFLALLVLILLNTTLRAQIAPPFVKATDPDRIEELYKQTTPYSELKWQRFDRPPFILFIEEQDRGSLLGLANQRAMPLLAAAKTFSERFAKPLGLKKRPRPLPVWILKSRDSYRKIGGSEFSAAHFNLLHEHTVTYYDKKQDLRRAFHTLMHEVVHQVMFQYTDPNKSLHQNFMSTWYMEGMAEHFATREPGPMLADQDPGFGSIDEDRIDEVKKFAGKRFNWRRRSRMPFIHHPMAVMVYNTLQSYFNAVGITQNEKEDYASQMGYFYRSSHSIISFLDNAYRGAFRNRLLEITKLEYEGRRGAVTINQVFARSEQQAFKALYDMFVQRPKAIADAELPKEFERLRKMSGGGGGGSGPAAAVPDKPGGALFDEPGSEQKIELPEAKELEPTGKLAAALALSELRNMVIHKAKKLLEKADGDAADKVREAVEAVEGTMDGFKAYVKENSNKARISLPNPNNPSRTLSWRVRDYRELENVFVLVRMGDQKLVRPSQMEPMGLAESAERVDLLKSPERQRAFGLLVSMSMSGADAKAKRAMERRAKKIGLVLDNELIASMGGVLEAASALSEARTQILTAKNPETVLDQLARRLQPYKSDEDVVELVDAYKGELIERAFERSKDWLSAYKGKTELLPGGKVRLSYDWSSGAHALDWIAVDPKKEGFQFTAQPEGDDHKGRHKVNTGKKMLELYGGIYLRHRLQFEGDVTFKFKIMIGQRNTENGVQNIPLNPGLIAINGLRPRSFVAANFLTAIGLKDGRAFEQKRFGEKDVRSIFEAVGKSEFVGLSRKGDTFSFFAGNEDIHDFKAKGLPAKGAAMILLPLPNNGSKVDYDSPRGFVGEVVIEGKPAAESLATARARFYSGWLRRFPK